MPFDHAHFTDDVRELVAQNDRVPEQREPVERLTEHDVAALLADARRHLRTGTGCESCVRGIERLAAAWAELSGASERMAG